MTAKEIDQRYKLLKDQLTVVTRFDEDFKKRLGKRGYQIYIDKILDEMLNLRKLKKELYGK
jgi:hypothetical protein